MAGEVVTTGTRAADAARADAQQGTNSSTQDAERAEAAVAANVPEPRVLNGAPDPKTAPQPARGTGRRWALEIEMTGIELNAVNTG